MELAGEVGPESLRRLEVASGANEGLNLPICKMHESTKRFDQ